MEIYIKGGPEDKIAFLIILLVFVVVCVVYKIKWWWEDKKDSGLCDLCSHWVKCKNRSSSFCLMKDLFTHTDKAIGEYCIDYDEGEPMTEEEFDNGGRYE